MLALQFAFNTSTENPVTEEPVTEKPVSEKPVSHYIHIVLDVAALYICWDMCDIFTHIYVYIYLYIYTENLYAYTYYTYRYATSSDCCQDFQHIRV